MSRGSDALRDVYAKLHWAEKHLADLTTLGEDYLRPGGGDERPLEIEFDLTRLPEVVARFNFDKPMPVEIGLHAADLIHNARTALDHVLARLKDAFGGEIGRGGFPITQSDGDWKGRVYPRRARVRTSGPLEGLPCAARMLIYREQPHVAYGSRREEDPLTPLSAMDNADKHRLLYPGFAYPEAKRGLDLIEVRNRKRVLFEKNGWTTGEPLVHGTVLARLVIRGPPRGLLRVSPTAKVRLSSGPLDAPRTTYEAMIARVRGVADKAAALIDAQP